ncbi:hypothetical protein ACJX0J_007775, partial [Zea mays]
YTILLVVAHSCLDGEQEDEQASLRGHGAIAFQFMDHLSFVKKQKNKQSYQRKKERKQKKEEAYTFSFQKATSVIGLTSLEASRIKNTSSFILTKTKNITSTSANSRRQNTLLYHGVLFS